MENKQDKKTKGKTTKGVVVSDKMDKTVVVAIEQLKEHPKYRKRYKSTKRYKAHDDKNECKIGDIVLISECRPISKDKKWRIAEIVKRAHFNQAEDEQ